MSQKLPADGFKWIETLLVDKKKINKFPKLIKNYNEESHEGYILEVDIEYPKDYMICILIYYFYQKE